MNGNAVIEAHPDTINQTDEAKHPLAMLLVMMLGSLIAVISVSLLMPSIPLIMNDLGINASKGQWLSTSFTIANAIMVPLSAYMSRRFSVRTNYIAAELLFFAASILGAFAQSYYLVLLARVIQGFSTGCLMPMTQIAVTRLFSKDRQGMMLGFVGIAIAAGPAIGSPLAGIIVQYLNWHSLFMLLAILSAADLVLCVLILRNFSVTEPVKFDLPSMILSGISISCFVLATGSLSTRGLFSAQVLAPVVLTAASTILFVKRQHRLVEPLLNMDTFLTKRYAIACLIGIAAPTTQLAGNLLIPLDVQNVYGGSVMDSALVLLPGALVMVIASPLIGRLYDLFGFRKIGIAGFLCLSVSSLGLIFVPESHPLVVMAVLQFLRSIGLGSVTMPTLSWALDALPADLRSSGSVTFHVIRMVACAFGPALASTIVVRTQEANSALAASQATGLGISYANLVLGIMTICAMITILIATRKGSTI